MGRKTEKQGSNNSSLWMVTFTDLIMLLLTFFVMLLTMKSLDDQHVKKVLKELALSAGPLEFVHKDKDDTLDSRELTQWIENAETLLLMLRSRPDQQVLPEEQTQRELLAGLVDVREDQRGVVITLQAENLFDSGSADVRADRREVIQAMGSLLKKVANDIIVLGHTDSHPIQSPQFPSNWELSVARALNVHDHLVKHTGLDPGQIAPGGFGDKLPRFTGLDAESMAKNRRVEFILKKRDSR